jgi:hypothetical protein
MCEFETFKQLFQQNFILVSKKFGGYFFQDQCYDYCSVGLAVLPKGCELLTKI